MNKTSRIEIRVTPKFKEKVEAKAKKEKLTVSEIILQALNKFIK